MEQSKFSLADLLTLFGGVAFAFICFLGINFETMGNTLVSVLLALAVFACLFVPAFLAKVCKVASRNFTRNVFVEFSLVVVFVIVLLFLSARVFPLYFNVSKNKDSIRESLSQEITQAESMFQAYDDYAGNRKAQYELLLKSVAAGKNTNRALFEEFGFIAGTPIPEQIDNKMFTLDADLFPSNYGDMKAKATEWLDMSRKDLDKWRAIGVVSVVNKVDRQTDEWLGQMTEFSTKREMGEIAEDFSYSLSFSDVRSYFKTDSISVSVKSMLISLGLGLLMLMSWIIARRSTRFPGWKQVFSRKTSMDIDNEL